MTVTKEMVQAFLDFIKEDTWAYCGEEEKQYYHIDGLVNVEAALEAALAVMPGPAVKVEYANRSTGGFTPAPDLTSENERLKKALEKIAAFGDGQPSNIHDLQEQRYSARAIRIARAALERG